MADGMDCGTVAVLFARRDSIYKTMPGCIEIKDREYRLVRDD